MEPTTPTARLGNRAQAALLLSGMALVLALCAQALAGGNGLFFTAVLLLAGMWLLPRANPARVLRLFRSVPVDPWSMPDVQKAARDLSARAGLPRPPSLWLVSGPGITAFSVGSPETSAIGISRRLQLGLNVRELVAILAHEIAHIAAGDMTLLALSEIIGRLTRALAMAGLLFGLAIAVAGHPVFSPGTVFLLAAAPIVASLLQLALSRNREFDADRGGAALTGDPEGLASALAKIERDQRSLLRRLFWPGAGAEVPLWIRTHPRTKDRIARLRGVAGR